MTTPEDMLLGLGYFAAAGVAWYLFRRVERYARLLKPSVMPPTDPGVRPVVTWKWRLAEVAIVAACIGLIYGIPELNGRSDATAMCDAIPVGASLGTDEKRLHAYLDEQRKKFGTLYAVNHYPGNKGVEDGSGAVVLVFSAGFPFSRAYCVLYLSESAVQSKQVIFNAEDQGYCAGEMRWIWNCPDERQSRQGS